MAESCLRPIIPDRARTCNLYLRRVALYPVELRGRIAFMRNYIHCQKRSKQRKMTRRIVIEASFAAGKSWKTVSRRGTNIESVSFSPVTDRIS